MRTSGDDEVDVALLRVRCDVATWNAFLGPDILRGERHSGNTEPGITTYHYPARARPRQMTILTTQETQTQTVDGTGTFWALAQI